MANDTGYKYVKNGNYYEAIPNTGTIPYGQKEVSYNEFINAANTAVNEPKGVQMKSFYDRMRQENPNAFVQGSESGIQMVNGVPTQTSAIDSNKANEAAVAAGTMKKVPVGSGFGYIPVGSAGDKNLQNPTTQPTGIIQGGDSKPISTNGGFSLTTGNLSTSIGSTKNDNVAQLQKLLGITADGYFGPQTKSAVMAFQQAHGLKVDGIVGPLTMAALNSGTPNGGLTTPSTFSIDTSKPSPNGQFNADGTAKNPQTEIGNINDKANAEAEALANSLASKNSSDNIDTSASSKMISELTKLVGTHESTTTPSLTEQLATKRASLGVDPLETNLNNIDSQIAKLDSDFTALQEKEGNRLVSMQQINRRKSQDQINYESAKNNLINQRNSIANELKTKYDVINTYMQYAGQDYNNAQQDYTTKFNESISLINLVKGVEDSQKSSAEKLIDNSKANLTLMLNTLKDKNYATVDPATKASIAKLELQAGLPVGTFEGILSAKDVFKPTIANTQEQVTIDSVLNNFNSIKGKDGYVDPYVYIQKRAQSTISPTEFDKKFGYFVNPLSKDLVGLGNSTGNPYGV